MADDRSEAAANRRDVGSTGVVDHDMTVERGRLGTGCWQMVTRAAASELTSVVGCYSGYREAYP